LIEELNKGYSSANIVRVIKSRRMRCKKRVAGAGEMRNEYKCRSVNTRRRDTLKA
jgi:hypothetical protein